MFSVSGKQFAQMASSFSMTRVIEFCETDMAGIVHFSNFYCWMEQAEHAFFRSLGLTIAHDQDDGTTIGFPRVSASCRFVSPARFEDQLTVRLQVQRIGVKSLTYDAIFSIGERLVANGTLKTVCCRFRPGESLESIVIPNLYLSKIKEYAD
jgi:YbgC/YbaW family acyl-CoA thioester hydrolase